VSAIIESPPRWDAALRLLGGIHHLALSGRASWDHLEDVLVEDRDFLRRFVSEQRVQTNEVQRCWALLPCFLELARRRGTTTFDMVELGTSAGLLLSWHRCRYRYEAGEWGPHEALLRFEGHERRPVPEALLAQELTLRGRVGIDLEPVDATTDDGALLLKSFVWADRHDRLERLDQAIAALRQDPPEIVQGDFVEVLPELLARRRPDALTVVLQVAAAGYLSDEGWERLEAGLSDAGAEAPLAYVFAGQPEDGSHNYWGLWVTTWPGGEREVVAHADFHGAWLEWLI